MVVDSPQLKSPETAIPFYAENIRFSNVHITCDDEPIWLRVDKETPFQHMRDVSFDGFEFINTRSSLHGAKAK
ncbi:MAG: hypothetical protein J6T51_03160 [Kiritimatiellae bacterium]|nr:hypothetical protein [Kiritimatiellia bacterium]